MYYNNALTFDVMLMMIRFQHFEDSTMKPLRSCETKLSGKKLKLEMEEFRDLTAYLPTVTTKPVLDSGDELNTPIFGKYANLFP